MPTETDKPTDWLPATPPAPIVEQVPIVEHQPTDIMGLLSQAIAQGTTIETIERLEQMHERMIARQAVAAFNVAKAEFHASCPPIIRRTENTQFFVTRDGRKVPSKYAKLDDIAVTIREPLAANGLSFSWTKEVISGEMLTLECVLSHVGGHREDASATFPLGSQAGSSPQQKYASTMTYAQRYSLICVLGLTSCDDDDDGASGGQPVERISEDQATKLYSFMQDVRCDFEKFYEFFGIKDAKELPLSRHDEAMRELDKKRKRQENQNG